MTSHLQKIKHGKFYPWIIITIGCALSAFGYTTFITPMKFYEGGVIGIAYLSKYIFNLPLGIVNIGLTYLIFIIGTKLLGKGFGIKSIYATTIFGIFLDSMESIKLNIFPENISSDPLLSAFFGGITIGVGMGLVFFHGASTGGSDAFAQIMRWLKRIPIGKTLITVDFFVLSLATIWAYQNSGTQGLETIMYSFVFIFIQIKTVDGILNGFNASQRIIITTDHPEDLKRAIFDKLQRGITVLDGTGGYTGIKKVVLTTVLPKKNIQEVIRIVSEVDERAFIMVHDVSQVYGQGFEALPKEGMAPDMKSIQ